MMACIMPKLREFSSGGQRMLGPKLALLLGLVSGCIAAQKTSRRCIQVQDRCISQAAFLKNTPILGDTNLTPGAHMILHLDNPRPERSLLTIKNIGDGFTCATDLYREHHNIKISIHRAGRPAVCERVIIPELADTPSPALAYSIEIDFSEILPPTDQGTPKLENQVSAHMTLAARTEIERHHQDRQAFYSWGMVADPMEGDYIFLSGGEHEYHIGYLDNPDVYFVSYLSGKGSKAWPKVGTRIDHIPGTRWSREHFATFVKRPLLVASPTSISGGPGAYSTKILFISEELHGRYYPVVTFERPGYQNNAKLKVTSVAVQGVVGDDIVVVSEHQVANSRRPCQETALECVTRLSKSQARLVQAVNWL